MCVIHVHAESHPNNAEQACAHNLDTVVSDMDILSRLAQAHGLDEMSRLAADCRDALLTVSTALWDDWQSRINPDIPMNDPRKTIGNERYQAQHANAVRKWTPTLDYSNLGVVKGGTPSNPANI